VCGTVKRQDRGVAGPKRGAKSSARESGTGPVRVGERKGKGRRRATNKGIVRRGEEKEQNDSVGIKSIFLVDGNVFIATAVDHTCSNIISSKFENLSGGLGPTQLYLGPPRLHVSIHS
jgi:hypothetical protein